MKPQDSFCTRTDPSSRSGLFDQRICWSVFSAMGTSWKRRGRTAGGRCTGSLVRLMVHPSSFYTTSDWAPHAHWICQDDGTAARLQANRTEVHKLNKTSFLAIINLILSCRRKGSIDLIWAALVGKCTPWAVIAQNGLENCWCVVVSLQLIWEVSIKATCGYTQQQNTGCRFWSAKYWYVHRQFGDNCDL